MPRLRQLLASYGSIRIAQLYDKETVRPHVGLTGAAQTDWRIWDAHQLRSTLPLSRRIPTSALPVDFSFESCTASVKLAGALHFHELSGKGEMFQMFRLSGRLDILLFLFFGGIIFAAGCGSSGPAAAPISVTITPSEAALGAGQTIPFAAATSDGSSVTWSASAGTIDATGNYTAPSGTQSVTVTVTATSKKEKTSSAKATVNVVAPGQVAATANVQVATYTISPAALGNVSVQFGTDTSYGLTTWAEPVPNGGGAVSVFVAGMKGNTLYHMRAVVQFSDGSQYTDADQTFTTGAYPVADTPVFAAGAKPGMTPQSGVELVDLVDAGGTVAQVVVADLTGNVLWSYNPTLPSGLAPNPIKLLPNGHFLINFSVPNPDGGNSILQEVDLSGETNLANDGGGLEYRVGSGGDSRDMWR